MLLNNLKVHHSKPFKEWLAVYKANIEVFYLPKYSHDLNPDEFLNAEFKREIRNRPDRREKGALDKSARSVMHRIQQKTSRTLACFQAPTTRYAA